jgi:hypothetical protein
MKDYLIHKRWWRVQAGKPPTPNPKDCSLFKGTVFLKLCLNGKNPILGKTTTTTPDIINYHPYSSSTNKSKPHSTPRRSTSNGPFAPLPKLWHSTVDRTDPKLTERTHTMHNMEGYFIAIGFEYEGNSTRAGAHTIRIQPPNYSTLDQHLQDIHLVAAHDTMRGRMRPKPPLLFYSNEPVLPARFLNDMLPQPSL